MRSRNLGAAVLLAGARFLLSFEALQEAGPWPLSALGREGEATEQVSGWLACLPEGPWLCEPKDGHRHGLRQELDLGELN